MKIEPIYQMKSTENESWIDIPKNLYNSSVPIKGKRTLFTFSDITLLQQESIANFYNTENKEYYQGAIDVLEQLITIKEQSINTPTPLVENLGKYRYWCEDCQHPESECTCE